MAKREFEHGNQPPVVELTEQMVFGKRFYVTPEGNKYPSVTTMLSGSGDKSWVEAWKAQVGSAKAQAIVDRATKRGTAVHDMVERYLKNQPHPADGHERAHVGLFNQIKLLLNRQMGQIRAQEIPLYSDALKIAGRVDCVAEYDGVLSIVDFKTSTNPKKDIESIEDYFLQCTAYAVMYYEMYGVPIDNIVIVMAVENSMVPMIFKGEIFDYLQPLQERVNNYYSKRQTSRESRD